MEIDVNKFDAVAREVFAPVYPVIAEQIRERTGITEGICLDVGCGGGYLGIALAKITDLYVYLLDKSREMLAIAEQNITRCGLRERMTTLIGDAQSIPFEDNSVDLVVSRGSVFFWENLEKAFKEIHRVLAPSGIAYIGGGFGTSELKKEITSKMEKRDQQWRKRIEKIKGEQAVCSLQKALQLAGIMTFSTLKEEAGLWMIIRKPGL